LKKKPGGAFQPNNGCCVHALGGSVLLSAKVQELILLTTGIDVMKDF